MAINCARLELFFFDFNEVTCLVILNLEQRKLVNGFDRLSIRGRNANLCATVELFVLYLLQPSTAPSSQHLLDWVK
jgi:hypothetical protein